MPIESQYDTLIQEYRSPAGSLYSYAKEFVFGFWIFSNFLFWLIYVFLYFEYIDMFIQMTQTLNYYECEQNNSIAIMKFAIITNINVEQVNC